MRRLFLFVFLTVLCHPANLCSQGLADGIRLHLQEQLRLFPQEKVCLHTDRTIFFPGDRICLKAYVVDAATLVPTLGSQYVYVELFDGQGLLCMRKKLIASTNLFTGYVDLPVDMAPGAYVLRASTLYSSQLKGYDCIVPVQVVAPPTTVLQEEASRPSSGRPDAAKPSRQSAVPVLRFFPEGGSLVEDAVCMVAFEATDETGAPVELEGDIVDSRHAVVSRFKTEYRGLGRFPLSVQKDERYTAVYTDHRGRQYTFPLPVARTDVASLTCRRKKDEVLVNVNRGAHFDAVPLYLLVQCRGQQVACHELKPGVATHLPLGKLPAGVNSLLLLDAGANVLSERLLFSCNSDQQCALTLETPDTLYGLRDSIPLKLSLPGMADDEFAFLSLAVTDDSITHATHSPSVWSQLLLCSDVQGIVDVPDDLFFPDYNAAVVDLLMMVNGWRRYDVSAVLHGQYARPQVERERSQAFKGVVRQVFAAKPVRQAEVLMLSKSPRYLAVQPVDSVGRFDFKDVNLPDSVEVFVQAIRSDEKRCSLVVEPQPLPTPLSSKELSACVRRQPEVLLADQLLTLYARNTHLLDEVVVKGKKSTPKAESIGGENATRTATRADIEKWGYRTLEQLLFDIPGLELDVAEGLVYSTIDRSSVQMNGGSQLLQLRVNDFAIEGMTYNDIDIEDVERVDVYVGTQALVFGTSPDQGILNVTLRSGNYLNRKPNEPFNRIVLHPLGYQEPVEYYYPRYPKGAQPSVGMPDVRRTLYWNPYLRMVAGMPLQLDFYSADVPTAYTVRVAGISSQGHIIDGQLTVNVGPR